MSEQNTNTAQAALPMKLEVRARPIEPKGNLLGFASIAINDSFVVDGLKILNSDKGLYVGMPSVEDNRSRTGYRDIAKPITGDFRKLLTDAVLGSYRAEVQRVQDKAAAISRGNAGIEGQLAKGKEQAAAENAARPRPDKPAKAAER